MTKVTFCMISNYPAEFELTSWFVVMLLLNGRVEFYFYFEFLLSIFSDVAN